MSSSSPQVDTMQMRSLSLSPAGAFRALTRTSLAMLQLMLLCYFIGYSQTVRAALRDQDGARMSTFLDELSRVTAKRASRVYGDAGSLASQQNTVEAPGSNTERTFTPKGEVPGWTRGRASTSVSSTRPFTPNSEVPGQRRRASTTVAPLLRIPSVSSPNGLVGSVERMRGRKKRIQRPTSRPPPPPSPSSPDPPATIPSISLTVAPTSQPAVSQETSTGPPQASSSFQIGKESKLKRKKSGIQRLLSTAMRALSGGRHRRQQTIDESSSTAQTLHLESDDVAGQGQNNERSERRSATLRSRFLRTPKDRRPLSSVSTPAPHAASSFSAGVTNVPEGTVWSIPIYKESTDATSFYGSERAKQLGHGGPTSFNHGTPSDLVVTGDPREATGKRAKWSRGFIWNSSRAAGTRSSSVVDSVQPPPQEPIYDLPPDAGRAHGSRDPSQVQETRPSDGIYANLSSCKGEQDKESSTLYDLGTWESSFDTDDEEAEPLSSHAEATVAGAVGERRGTSEHDQQEQESIYEVPSTGSEDADTGYASQAQQEPSVGPIYGNLPYVGSKITDSLSSPSKSKGHSSAQKSHAQYRGSTSPAKDETVDTQEPVYYQDVYNAPAAVGSGHGEEEYEEISLGPSLLMQATEQEQRARKKPATKKAKKKSVLSNPFLRLLPRRSSTSPSLEQQSSSASPVNGEFAGPNFDSEEPIYEDMRAPPQETVL